MQENFNKIDSNKKCIRYFEKEFSMLEKFYLRRPVEADKKSVLDLMIRCDIRDVGQPDSDMHDLDYDWRQIDLKQDTWLAFNSKGTIQGYGAVLPWSCGKRLALYDDPGTEKDELFLGLLTLCEKRAVLQLLEMDDPQKRTLVTHVSDPIIYQKKLLENAGYSIDRYIFNMHMDLEREIPAPVLPQDVEIRTAQTGVDDKHIHAVIQKAFAKPNKPAQPFNEWKEFMMRADLYQADLWFLAVCNDEIVGTCLCFPYQDLGWVRQLAVEEKYRRQGLGSALLLQAFLAFKQLGYHKVGLAVESTNEKAYRFYEKTGMTKTVHLDEYAKKIEFIK
jgi:ribosomal protein S18 acetylase RimI-like enzyme